MKRYSSFILDAAAFRPVLSAVEGLRSSSPTREGRKKRNPAIPVLLLAFALLALLAIACGGDGDTGAAAGGGTTDSVPDGGPSAATAFQVNGGGQPQGISVSAQGAVTADPDTALLSLGVSVLRDTARDARDEAAEAMDDLLDSLDDNNIVPEDIKTTQFSINPEFNYSGSIPRLTGYRVTNTVSVKVRDLDRVAEVIDEAVDAVGDPIQISGVTFTVDDPDPPLSQARADAMAQAQAKAQELADLAGVDLGSPIAISESSGGGLPPVFFDAARFAAAEEAATPIEPGQLEMTVTVQVTYAIQ